MVYGDEMKRYLVIRREALRPGKYSERVQSDCDTRDAADRVMSYCTSEQHREIDAMTSATYRIEEWNKP